MTAERERETDDTGTGWKCFGNLFLPLKTVNLEIKSIACQSIYLSFFCLSVMLLCLSISLTVVSSLSCVLCEGAHSGEAECGRLLYSPSLGSGTSVAHCEWSECASVDCNGH